MKFQVSTLAFVAMLFAGPSQALAMSLTGIWEGTEQCEYRLDGMEMVKQKVDITVAISQSGSDLNVDWTGFLGNDFNGVAINAPDSLKGEAALIACGSSAADSGTVVRWKAKTTEDGRGSLKGAGTAAVIGGKIGAFCKFSLKRVSILDTVVPACP